jgi:hypothetical protein
MKQVPREHYAFATYTGFERWASYYYQIKTVLELQPRSMLEIGKGDGFLGRFIHETTAIQYRSLDVAADLEPDLVGTVDAIPLADGAVDLSVAFEVLEHLPFERFEVALRELRRVSRRNVVISLPHAGPRPKLALKLPGVREVRLAAKLPLPRRHEFKGEHHWEIGKRGYSVARVRELMRGIFKIEKDFIPFESGYHHFFVLST